MEQPNDKLDEHLLLMNPGRSKVGVSAMKSRILKGAVKSSLAIFREFFNLKRAEYELRKYGNKNTGLLLDAIHRGTEKCRSSGVQIKLDEIFVLALWLGHFETAYQDAFWCVINEILEIEGLEKKDLRLSREDWPVHKHIKATEVKINGGNNR